MATRQRGVCAAILRHVREPRRRWSTPSSCRSPPDRQRASFSSSSLSSSSLTPTVSRWPRRRTSSALTAGSRRQMLRRGFHGAATTTASADPDEMLRWRYRLRFTLAPHSSPFLLTPLSSPSSQRLVGWWGMIPGCNGCVASDAVRQSIRGFASDSPPPSRPTASSVDDDKDSLNNGPSVPPPPPDQPSFVVDRVLPLSARPYARLARLDKPIGTMLLLWPCMWSTVVAAAPGCWPDPALLGTFAVGAFVMRGAGCTINDMWDAKFDRSVERTKTRPLASGELSMGQATAFLAAQMSLGLGVLLSLPHLDLCFQLGAASLPLVVSYPLMKRYTNWPQLVLGMAMNWGAFMGWAAVHGSLDMLVVVPLYCSGIAWTLVYDTLYAHQDKVDDAKLGLKSTALHFGQNTKPILHGFAAASLANWALVGYGLGYTSPFYYAGCGFAWSHLAWQVHTADLDHPENLAARFKSNSQVGWIMFATCVAGNLAAGGV